MAKVYRRIARLLHLNTPTGSSLEEVHRGLVKWKERMGADDPANPGDHLFMNHLVTQLRYRHLLQIPLKECRAEMYKALALPHTVIASEMLPNPLKDGFVQCLIINSPIGRQRRFFMVVQSRRPETLRFFITNSGARSYFEHLCGMPRDPNNEGAAWGWWRVEELHKFLTKQVV